MTDQNLRLLASSVGSVAFPSDSISNSNVQETLGTFGFRVFEERFGVVGLFNDAPAVQQDDVVGDGSRELHFVVTISIGLPGTWRVRAPRRALHAPFRGREPP